MCALVAWLADLAPWTHYAIQTPRAGSVEPVKLEGPVAVVDDTELFRLHGRLRREVLLVLATATFA